MSGLLKICTRSNNLIYKRLFGKQETRYTQWKKEDKVRLTDRFKTVNVHLGKKGWTFVSLGTIIAVEIGVGLGEFMRIVITGMTACVNFLGYIENLEEEEGNKFTECLTYIRRNRKEKKRKEMIGTGVGPGLAWFYYATYLQYILAADIEDKVKTSELLTEEERKRMPMKVFALLPRKCFIDILENDDSIKVVGTVTFDEKKKFGLLLISIMDGQTKYYCLIDCPSVLRTMTEVNDIQMAGISRFKYSSLGLPWNKNARVQLFTVDTKLVQLMRFYYTLNSILCMKKDFWEKASLVLYNESNLKPSEVLLQAIKTDLNLSKTEKLLSQVKKCSLMERKLLSAEEQKDIDYPFEVFVTHRTELSDKEKTNKEEYNEDLMKEIHASFVNLGVRVLLEKDCVGKDWLSKLKYAATKCRWIVFLDTKKSLNKNSNGTLFISHKVTESINRILEAKKVQTIAIVNSKDNMHILDDLRWVTCIPCEEKERQFVINTLLDVIKGIDLRNAKDVYFQPGEVAVGLAWQYAASNLTKLIPLITETIREKDMGLPYQLKLFIHIREICEEPEIPKAELSTNGDLKSSPSQISEEGNADAFKIVSNNWRKKGMEQTLEAVCCRQYPLAMKVIRQMKEEGLLGKGQVQFEVDTFCQTVDKIMQILLPDQTDNYEFVHMKINDDKTTMTNGIMNIYKKDEFADLQERTLFVFSQF